jgi:hypothetical protein
MRPWSSTIILGIYLRTSPSQLNVKPPILDLLIIGEKYGLAAASRSAPNIGASALDPGGDVKRSDLI